MNDGADILNQDEIDALLRGVDAGAVSTESPSPVPGEVRAHNLATQHRIVRGRMPTLEMINGRFARLLRIGIFNLLRRSPTVSATPVRVTKFGDYTQTLPMPSSLNIVRIKPLRGMALFAIDPKLVFAVVDHFFGGTGRHTKIEGRDFTRTEQRIIQLLLDQAFSDMREAWAPVASLDVEYVSSEINPNFANIVSPSEIVVVTAFNISLESSGGQLDVAMPYSMIEPMRDVLDSGMQSDRAERDENWSRTLRDELLGAEIELVPLLGRSTMSLQQLMQLKSGDVIACDFDGHVTLLAEDVPVLRGRYGLSHGQQAVQITEHLNSRGMPMPPDKPPAPAGTPPAAG